MKRLAPLALVLSALITGLLLAGCNTVNGIGKDISRAGDAISGASKK